MLTVEKWAAGEWQGKTSKTGPSSPSIPRRLLLPYSSCGDAQWHIPLASTLRSFLSPRTAFILFLTPWRYLAPQMSPELTRLLIPAHP